MRYEIAFELNGEAVEVYGVRGGESLLEVLRNRVGVTSTKPGCLTGDCGCCNVHLDGDVVPACLVLAVTVDGREVRTVESLAEDGSLSPLQEAFDEHYAAQCGYCTSGQLMSAQALLDENPSPSREEAKHGMAGNLCRCTGYRPILDAVLAASSGEGGGPVSGNGHSTSPDTSALRPGH